MKQGKGIFFAVMSDRCWECHERIGPGSLGEPAYWASERMSAHYGDTRYYHRSCARRVTKRREAERARNMAEYKALQAAQKAKGA